MIHFLGTPRAQLPEHRAAYILGTLMTEKIIAFVFQFVIHVINAGGYAGIIGLITCNSCGIPIPSEIIMPFSGYLVYLGRFNLFSWRCGCGGLQYRFGNCVLDRRQGRAAAGGALRQLGLDEPRDLDLMTRFFEKYGSIAILIGRMMPIVQTYVAFPAGIAKMPRLRFHIYTTMGSLIWYFCLAWVGMKLGQAGIPIRACSRRSIVFIWPWS